LGIDQEKTETKSEGFRQSGKKKLLKGRESEKTKRVHKLRSAGKKDFLMKSKTRWRRSTGKGIS